MGQSTSQDFCISLLDLSQFLKIPPEKLKLKLHNFLRSGFLSNSRLEDEVLAKGANTRTTNEELDKKSKQKASRYYLAGPKSKNIKGKAKNQNQNSLTKELHSLFWIKNGLISPQLTKYFLKDLGYEFPQKTVSVQMLKGGVAKTTTVLNLGLRAAMYGARVLFIDLDQQANLTFALGEDGENKPIWVDILEKKADISECILRIDGDENSGIDLIPSGLNNSVLDRVLLNANRNWAQSVRAPLGQIKSHYDLILIDTAPALSAINTAVTCASDEVLLPVNPDKFSMIGLRKNLKELADVRVDFGLRFVEKILFTKFDSREKASHELLQTCIDSFADNLMKSYIRISSEVKKSICSEKNIFQGRSTVKDDYNLATLELLDF